MRTNTPLEIQYTIAAQTIKAAILQSQHRAVKQVNKEQLILYYGIGRYISENSRNGYWGTGAVSFISNSLQSELPGFRGFSERNLENIRTFYEEWHILDRKSSSATKQPVEAEEIRQL